MNKTRRRAVQKHRAKDQKFAARRKADQEMAGGARARAQMQAPQPAPQPAPRPRTAARPQPDVTGEQGEQVSGEPAE